MEVGLLGNSGKASLAGRKSVVDENTLSDGSSVGSGVISFTHQSKASNAPVIPHVAREVEAGEIASISAPLWSSRATALGDP